MVDRLIQQIAIRKAERAFFSEIFTKAGFEHVILAEIKNRYWNEITAPPWFAVTTEMGFFVIGWRKRVISIEWRDVTLPAEHFDDLGSITHGQDYVHAYGMEKAIEYLVRVRLNATRIDPNSLSLPFSESELQLVVENTRQVITSALDRYVHR